MPVPFYADGLRFSCKRCSVCCRGAPGFVYLSQNDLNALRGFLNIGKDDFIRTYCRWVPVDGEREILSLQEKDDYDCAFWDGGCAVYAVRPLQCKSYPFWFSLLRGGREAWDSLAAECPGINDGELRSREEIDAWIAQRENEPYIYRKRI